MIQINIKFIPFLPDDSNIYLVGGTVRDILLGTPPKDYDLVTTDDPKALAEQIAEKAKSRAVALGKPGLRIYRVTAGEQTFDIAPAKGGTIESDLKKRDFTINALAVSAATGKLIDLQNGIEDLHDAKIRMVSEENLTEDPLRMLRAYRMGACLNFTIEPKTGQTISKGAFRIYTSAGERIRDELLKLFGAANSYPYLAEMDETGLLSGIFPEIEPLKHCQQNRFHDADVFAHTLSAYAHLEKGISSPETLLPDTSAAALLLESAPCVPLLKYSLLLHDLGKPETRTIDEKGTVHFYTHEAAGARIVGVEMNRDQPPAQVLQQRQAVRGFYHQTPSAAAVSLHGPRAEPFDPKGGLPVFFKMRSSHPGLAAPCRCRQRRQRAS